MSNRIAPETTALMAEAANRPRLAGFVEMFNAALTQLDDVIDEALRIERAARTFDRSDEDQALKGELAFWKTRSESFLGHARKVRRAMDDALSAVESFDALEAYTVALVTEVEAGATVNEAVAKVRKRGELKNI